MPSNHTTYYLGKDNTPDIIACVIHADTKCTETYTLKTRGSFGGVIYGLCKGCVELLEIDSLYKWVVEEKIDGELLKIKQDEMH